MGATPRRSRAALLACSLLIALAATACGQTTEKSSGSPVDQNDTTGITDKTIKISIVMGFGGPYGEVVEAAYHGFETAMDDINAAGGVDGREIEVVKVDHRETTAGGVAACKEVQSNGSFMAAVLQGNAGANTSATKCLDEAGVPTLYFASEADDSLTRAFTYTPSASTQGVLAAGYLVDAFGDDGRIGVVYDEGQGYQAMNDGFQAEAEKRGLDVAVTEKVTTSQSSFVPVLAKMKDADVETLVMFVTAQVGGIVRDSAAIGFEPGITGAGYVFDFVTIPMKDAAKGLTGLSASATLDSDAFAAYMKRMDAHGRATPAIEDRGFVLYGAGLLLGEMLKQAGGDPSRESVVTGSEKIRDYDNEVLPPITFGPGDHVGTEAAFPAECCNADFTWTATGPAVSEFG